MITNFFIPELNNHDVQELWFQQDGATCHTARATIDLLKDTFGDRLISRFGPVNWPPRSCDLTPLDYFLWGYVKSLVYADKPQTLDHLEDNIRRVIADIRPQMLEKVIENWTSRLCYISASRDSHMPEIILKIAQQFLSHPKPMLKLQNLQLHPNRSKYNKPNLPSFDTRILCKSDAKSSMPTVSTSSSNSSTSTSPSIPSAIPTIQSESQLLIPIPITATPDNSLNISASSLSTETRLFPATSNKFAALSTEIQPSVPLLESVATTSNSEPSIATKIPKSVKQNSKNRRKRTKVQKPEIAK
ncbi:hypothetical protein TNCV_4272071 [Trichonephila clavipes]|nr:hypothetical protein TNCV_4272071 [Trichonephila clavipes]